MGNIAVRLERHRRWRLPRGGDQPLDVFGLNLFGGVLRDVLEPCLRGARESIRTCGGINRYGTTGGLKPLLVEWVWDPDGAATMTGLSSAPGLVGTAC